MMREHPTFAAAYLGGLKTLLEDGAEIEGVRDRHSVGSGFGDRTRPTIELLAHTFTVTDPQACLLAGGFRSPREAYIAGQWAWVMAGSEDADHISFYNARGHEFADSEGRLAGAFGARMRRSGGDQLGRSIERLRRDPSSRRAVITIADPGDGRSPSRDFPCALALQLLVRNGQLEAITNMRSQSALMVLPYDAALMMMVQLWAASRLGLEAGPHHWTANSFHVYADEVADAEALIGNPPSPRWLPVASSEDDRLGLLLTHEAELRRRVSTGTASAADLEIPPALAREDDLLGWVAAAISRHVISREVAVGRLGVLPRP
jgi:thymidylate synthase